MRKIILTAVLSFLLILPSLAQLDRSKRPGPGPAPKIELGEYKSFTLDNGLKVFVVQNNKLPVINIRLVLDRDPIVEGNNAGYITIAGELLRTGTKTRTKDQIDEEVDFIGASLSTGSTSIFGSSLKKHSEKLLDLISDIILNYNFTQEELDKLKKQYISSITANKDEPDAIAATVQNALVYGKEHPYGETMTEQTVSAVTLDMCKKYIETYFKPNIGYLALVGDITVDEAKTLAEKYFSKWQKGEVPKHKYNDPKAPSGINVALVDRPASVQSVIAVAYPVHIKLGDPDYIPANLMNTMFGGTSTSRLYMNLRESKGYTYGAYSSLNTDRLVGSFDASLQARNEVTDSSVTEIFKEMKKYRETGATEEELSSIKNYVTGSFARALENPQTIATFAINTAIYKLPSNYYSTYLKKVAAVKVSDVNSAIKEYINPDNAYVVVVGNAAKVKSGLAKFGNLDLYDIYGDKIDTTQATLPEGLDGQSVLNKYIDAIGGRENLQKVQDRQTEMTGKIQNFDIKTTISQRAPNMMRQSISAMGMDQLIVFDGTKGAIIVNNEKTDLAGPELEKLKLESAFDLILDPAKYGIKLNLAGSEVIEGKKAYRLEFILADSTKWTQFYDIESGLKIKDIKILSSNMGTFNQETLYSDYREVEGVKYPFALTQSVGPQKFSFTVSSIKINSGLTEEQFRIP